MFESIKNMSREWKQRILIISFVCLLVIAGAYLLNDRFGTQSNGGTITVTAPVDGTIVYVDTGIADVMRTAGDTFEQRYTPGAHRVIVHQEDYWPWKKDIELERDERVALRPFLLPTKATVALVATSSPEYATVTSSLRTPGTTYTLTSPDGNTEVSVTASSIKTTDTEGPCVSTCDTLLTEDTIKNVSFLPGRTDVVLVAIGNGIFALETSLEGTQNIQPLYKGGTESTFYISSPDNTLYIHDAGKLYKLVQ